MFYKGLNLSGSSTAGAAYTMSDVYDLGHLYRFMQAVSAASSKYGGPRGGISLSIHCEQPEVIRTMIHQGKDRGLGGLQAYSHGRPPLPGRLAHAAAERLSRPTHC